MCVDGDGGGRRRVGRKRRMGRAGATPAERVCEDLGGMKRREEEEDEDDDDVEEDEEDDDEE